MATNKTNIYQSYQIIVVEDHQDLNYLICKNLKREGFRTAAAHTGEEGLAKISGNDREILLVDYFLPDMNAKQLILELKEQGIEIPFVVMTGHGDEKIAVEMMKMGARDYIIKQEELIELLIPKLKQVCKELDQEIKLIRAREKLLKSEKKYRSLVEDMDDLVCRFDLNENPLFVNQAYCRFFGIDAAEIDNFRNFVPEEDQSKVEDYFQNLVKSGKADTIEHRVIDKNKQIRWIHWRNHPITNENDEVIAFQGIGRDITDRKKTEKELKRARLLFKLFMDNLPGTAYIKDDNNHILYNNKNFASILNCEPEELIGENTFKYISKEMEEKFKSENAKVLNENKPYEFEHTYEINGSLTYWLTRKFPINFSFGEENNQLLGTISFDITERKKAEQALRESENKFRSLVEQAAEMLFLHDTDGKIIDVNQAAIKNTGYSKKELLNMNVFDIDPDAENRRDRTKYWKKMKPQDDPITFEARHQCKDGTIYPTEITISKVVLSDNNYIFALAKDITERKKAEQKIRDNRNYLQSIFRAAPVGIGVVHDRNLKSINKEICRITGYSKDELIGKNARILYPSDEDYQFVGREKYEQIEKFGTGTVETRWQHKNGNIINILLSSTPIDTDDLSKGVTFTALDITERVQAEMALKESEDKYRRLIENSPYIAYIYGSKSGAKFWSDRVQDILGYKPDKLKENPFLWHNSIHKEDKSKVIKAIRESKEGKSFSLEYRMQDSEGEWHWIRDRSISIRDEDNETIIEGLAIDITKEKQAEEELKRSRERYKTVFENSAEATIIIEKDTTISMANKEFEKLSGYSKEEVENKMSWTQFVSPKDLDKMRQYHVERRKENGNPPRTYEFDFIDREGNISNIITNVDLLPNSEKSIASFLDITARKKAEREREKLQDQLLQTQKLESIGTLAGGVAHDFNNILTVIIGLSQLVLSRTSKADPNYGNLESILNSAERAADLTRQLLLFSRKQEMDFEIIDLNDTISSLRKMLDRLISEDIKMHNKFTYELWPIKADTSQIEQVITNLVVNARDAMPGGGDLMIRTQNIEIDEERAKTIPDLSPGRYVCMEIEDTGHGIDEDIQENIFDPFFTTKGRAKGTGMGLSVVHGIIKKHNGVINVESEPGEGTIFRIYLPAAREEAEHELQKEAETFDKYKGRGETILLVEDEKSFLDYLENALETYGYNIYSTQNGEQALKIFKKHRDEIELLLSDVVMPDTNGIEVADRCKALKDNLKVILSSGYSDDKVNPARIREKGYKFIQKPYGVLKILKSLRDILSENE